MNYKKVLAILFFPLLLHLIVGCCDCLETLFFEYSNCSVSVQNLDNAGRGPIVATSDKVPKEAFGIRVAIERKEGMCANGSRPSFFSSAYATSCDCPPEQLYLPLDSIVSIKIKSLMDFDAAHASDEYISGYFGVLMGTEFKTIDEFIIGQQNELYGLDGPGLQVDLMLMVPPAEKSVYQFEVQIELSDGRTLNGITDLIELI